MWVIEEWIVAVAESKSMEGNVSHHSFHLVCTPLSFLTTRSDPQNTQYGRILHR